MTAEEWRSIPGWEEWYEVSDMGRVRSLDRVDAGGKRRKGRILAPTSTSDGHLQVGLHRGRQYTVSVHRLVLQIFVGPPPDGTEGCHGNGDPSDNRLANLRWDTRSENVRDRTRHGTHHMAVKTECPQGHAYDATNTYTHRGSRYCRRCRGQQASAYKSRQRASATTVRESS